MAQKWENLFGNGLNLFFFQKLSNFCVFRPKKLKKLAQNHGNKAKSPKKKKEFSVFFELNFSPVLPLNVLRVQVNFALVLRCGQDDFLPGPLVTHVHLFVEQNVLNTGALEGGLEPIQQGNGLSKGTKISSKPY